MHTDSTLLPGTRIITFSLRPSSRVSSFSRRDTFRHCTMPPSGGFLETLMLRLCFILDCPFRKAICFVLPFGVPRKGAGFVRVLDGNSSKTFSWRLRWTQPPTEIWCSLMRRSPAESCHPHTGEGGAAESQ